MKTGIITKKTFVSEDLQSSKSIMGMSMKGMEMAQYFMRDKIYSDKVLAVVREYISNARDEHIKYRITQPINVFIESRDGSYVWGVRDYAMGLNEHDVRNIFAVYFESTKSAENNSIGGFGIGGKAAFCYSDTYYVVSHHNGVKATYVCTLGASGSGIPIGEIYKVSEEPTTEQGIEVSVDVKNSDIANFINTTKKFVRTFTSPIEFKEIVYNTVTVPAIPLHTKTIGDFTIEAYKASDIPDRQTYNNPYLRMGGVIYGYENYSFSVESEHIIVIDVPIGKLTLPISRERIESTALNTKVYVEITKFIDEVRAQEKELITCPKLGAVLTQEVPFGKTSTLEYFSHNYTQLFPLTHYTSRHIVKMVELNQYGYNGMKNLVGKRKPIHIIPDIKNTNSWKKRLISYYKNLQGLDYEGFLYISEVEFNNMAAKIAAGDKNIDITDCDFIDVKKMKLPKLQTTAKDTTKFLVYFRNSNWKNTMNAEELIKHSDERIANFLKNNPNVKVDYTADDWYDQVTDLNELEYKTIVNKATYGFNNLYYYTNSKAMIESLLEAGWIEYGSKEYNKKADEIRERHREQRELEAVESRIKDICLGAASPRTAKAIKKYTDSNIRQQKLDKIDKVMRRIFSEDSCRGRILRQIRHSYASKNLTREDIRKIMNLK
jgi:hypothetical protein